MCNVNEPDWVNHGPELDGLPLEQRCQYVFEYDWKYEDRSVQRRPCGLPVPDDHIGKREELCYFHSQRERGGDDQLKERIEAAVHSKRYLGEAALHSAPLAEAQLSEGVLPFAGLVGANLQGADLCLADLCGTSLCVASLHGADLVAVRLVNADLTGATVAPLQVIDRDSSVATTRIPDLRWADLRGALLAGAAIAPEADLTGAKWGETTMTAKGYSVVLPRTRYHVQDERCARSDTAWEEVKGRHKLDDSRRPVLGICEGTYRQLKLSCQRSGDYQTAGEFFLREMECKRAQMVQDKEQAPEFWGRCGAFLLLLPLVPLLVGRPDLPLDGGPLVRAYEAAYEAIVATYFFPFLIWACPMRRRAAAAAMYLLCGYGERPSWIAAWILVLILIFAGCHSFAGVADLKAAAEGDVAASGIVHSPWTALYFSVITFTSLGYADLAPTPGIGRALAGLEAAAGIVLMSLFLICIVRKYSR